MRVSDLDLGPASKGVKKPCYDDYGFGSLFGAKDPFAYGFFPFLGLDGFAYAAYGGCADFASGNRDSYEEFVSMCSVPVLDGKNQMTAIVVRDICRYTCGVCVEVPYFGAPTPQRPTKRPTRRPTIADPNEPTGWPTGTYCAALRWHVCQVLFFFIGSLR